MIHQYKYRKKFHLGKRLARLLVREMEIPPLADGLLPVPLHPRKLREREFNQSLVLTRVLAGLWRMPWFPDLLIRTRDTPPQVELKHPERVRNMKGAFALKRGAAVEGKRWILIDDVMTSGATLNECSRVLKRGGAEKVYAVTLARVLEEREPDVHAIPGLP
jgi:ComF family protein